MLTKERCYHFKLSTRVGTRSARLNAILPLNFFEMVDALTNEEFLLNSTGMTELHKLHGSMQMYFYILGFNGMCWQTYGSHAYFRGMIPSDLLFFARQFDPNYE